MPNHPAPTIQADLALVTQDISFNGLSHVAQVTYAIENSTHASAQTVADDVQAEWNGHVGPLLSVDAVSQSPRVLLGDGSNVPSVAFGAGTPLAGSATGVMPSPQISVLVKKITAFAGKKARGRLYVPYTFKDTLIDQTGLLDPTTLASHQVIYNAWLVALAGVSKPMVISNKTLALDPVTHKPFVTAITTGHQVTSVLLERFCATQRRRLVRT